MSALNIPAWIGIGCWLAAMLWLGWIFVRAPRGYEDEDGFHPGRRPGEAEEIARLRNSEADEPAVDRHRRPEARPRRHFRLFGKRSG